MSPRMQGTLGPEVENLGRRVLLAFRGQGAALSKAEAADLLSISVDSFERHVMGDLRTVRIGGRVLIPAKELDRWLEENARSALS
jgi:excisionase family DNA binding protein